MALAVSAAYSIEKANRTLANAKSIIEEATRNPHHLLSSSQRAHTMELIDQVSSAAAQAQHTLSTSPGVAAMWAVPYLHTQRQALLDLVSNIRTMSDTGRDLLTSLDSLVSLSHGTTISIPALDALHDQIVAADDRLSPLGHTSSGLFPLLPPLARAQSQFVHDDARITGLLSDGTQLTTYAKIFLGGDGPRTYYLAGENNAEMRDQGAVLSYATITADAGTFSVVTPSSISAIRLNSPANYPVPAGTNEIFGDYEPTQVWQSVNATADFPWTGGDVQAMYQQASGNHVNGVVALDVPGLARILKVVGPVRVPGITQTITSGNVATVILHDLYANTPPEQQQSVRRDEVSAVAKAAFDKMKKGHVDLAAFADALANDVAGRHLLAYDEVPSNEATITKFGGSGAIDTNDPTHTFHVAVENGGADKLDYYVNIGASFKVIVNPDGSAAVETTVTGTNTAPPNPPPSYQFGPDNITTFIPGQYNGNVYLWGPQGSQQAGGVSESGLVVSPQFMVMLPQQTQSVQFVTVIPHAVVNGHLHLVFVPQPRLRPDVLNVQIVPRGWSVSGPPVTQHTYWSKTLSWTWNLSP